MISGREDSLTILTGILKLSRILRFLNVVGRVPGLVRALKLAHDSGYPRESRSSPSRESIYTLLERVVCHATKRTDAAQAA